MSCARSTRPEKRRRRLQGQVEFRLADRLSARKADADAEGDSLIAIAHYDNSLNNKYNPDATKEVHWGDQNWEEMQGGFLGLVVDKDTNVTKIFIPSGPSLLPRGKSGPTLATVLGLTR